MPLGELSGRDGRDRRKELPALLVDDLVERAAVGFDDGPQRMVRWVADPEQICDLVVVGHAEIRVEASGDCSLMLVACGAPC